MTRNKTVFVTVFHSFVTKNVLNTDAFKMLASEENLHIVLLVPEVKRDFFIKTYGTKNVAVESLSSNIQTSTWFIKLFSIWAYLLIDSMYLKYKKHERLEVRKNLLGYLKFFWEIVMTKLMVEGRFPHSVFRHLFLKYAHSQEIKEIFERYNPKVVFSTDVFDERDCLVAAESRRRNLKLIGMVRSWDNCYSKGLLRVIPDKLVVNNPTIKDEATSLHDVPAEDIVILGSPQHDVFINNKRTPRGKFFSSMNLDQDKKLVLFAPAGSILSDTDGEVTEIFKKALEDGKFKQPVQFLIRNHPNHPANLNSIASATGMVVENPGVVFNPKNPKDTELTQDDNEHLADELFYADVVVWVATTLPLDAVVFDKPLVSVDFDGLQDKTYYKSVRKYHDEDHMLKMLKCGGVSIATNPVELIEMINVYLDNPDLHREGRLRMLKQQFYKLDGQAGRRIGEYIISMLA